MMNTKNLLIAFIFAISSGTVFSQYDGMRFGMKVAPSFSWINPEMKGFETSKPKMDFTYGVIAEFPFTDNAAFASGFEIVNAGGNIDFPIKEQPYYMDDADTFNLDKRKYKLRYANIPLTIKFKTNEIGYSMFYGQFGLDMGFRVKSFADDKGIFAISKETENKGVDIHEDINFVRLAMNIGGGVEYYITGNTHLLVGISFSNGFTNILQKKSNSLKNSIDNKRLEQNAINNYVSMNVGILF